MDGPAVGPGVSPSYCMTPPDRVGTAGPRRTPPGLPLTLLARAPAIRYSPSVFAMHSCGESMITCRSFDSRRVSSAFVVAALLALSLLVPATAQEKTALVGATLIDGTGRAPVPDAVVVIEGDKITAAGPASSITVPTGARVLRLSG